MVRALHIFWGLGVAAWNAIGLYRIQNNEAPLGPTASMAVGLFGLAIALIFLFTNLVKRNKWMYIGLCAICGLLCTVAVYGAFTKDPSLWPSETWRWAGILLNGTGFFSFVFGVLSNLKIIK